MEPELLPADVRPAVLIEIAREVGGDASSRIETRME